MTQHLADDAAAALTLLLVADAPLGETVHRIAQLARDAVGPAVAVGLTLYDDDGAPGTTVLTDDVSPGSEELSVPLVASDNTVGVLSMYAERPFGPEDEVAVGGFATQAAVVLANARSYWTTHDLAVGLQAALDSRAVIDMAKGKLMARDDISPDEAFALLVRASQRENVKLRDIARRIIEGSADGSTEA